MCMDNVEDYSITARSVTRKDGARSKFGAPMFEPEVFRKQMYCIEVLVTLLGVSGVPRSH